MKDPIQRRTCFVARRRDGSLVDCDWNLVNHATLGAMVEPRILSFVQRDGLANVDLDDVSFSDRREVDPTVMFGLVGTWGDQIPADYNTQ